LILSEAKNEFALYRLCLDRAATAATTTATTAAAATATTTTTTTTKTAIATATAITMTTKGWRCSCQGRVYTTSPSPYHHHHQQQQKQQQKKNNKRGCALERNRKVHSMPPDVTLFLGELYAFGEKDNSRKISGEFGAKCLALKGTEAGFVLLRLESMRPNNDNSPCFKFCERLSAQQVKQFFQATRAKIQKALDAAKQGLNVDEFGGDEDGDGDGDGDEDDGGGGGGVVGGGLG